MGINGKKWINKCSSKNEAKEIEEFFRRQIENAISVMNDLNKIDKNIEDDITIED